MDLKALRDELDTIDSKLLALYLRRMSVVREVAEFKIENNLPVLHPGREAEILAWAEQEAGEEMAPYALRFFRELLASSKALQESLMEQL